MERTYTYQVNAAAAEVFNKAAGLLMLAEESNSDSIAQFIDLAYDAAVVFCPQIAGMPWDVSRSWEKRRAIGFASALYLKHEEGVN